MILLDEKSGAVSASVDLSERNLTRFLVLKGSQLDALSP